MKIQAKTWAAAISSGAIVGLVVTLLTIPRNDIRPSAARTLAAKYAASGDGGDAFDASACDAGSEVFLGEPEGRLRVRCVPPGEADLALDPDGSDTARCTQAQIARGHCDSGTGVVVRYPIGDLPEDGGFATRCACSP
jgi:hypothetical protein